MGKGRLNNHDYHRKSSEMCNAHWVYAERKKGKYPSHTSRGGKWLIFAKSNEIGQVWAKVKKATEDGRLGGFTKVRTSKANQNTANPDINVICIYTHDWTDEKDVKRIREELRKLGITNKIPYKTDQDTLNGKYRCRGHKRISKYYE